MAGRQFINNCLRLGPGEARKIGSSSLSSPLWRTLLAICLVVSSSFNAGRAETHKLSVSSRPKVGLALGGGGARGAAHVGVLRILEEQGIPIDYVAGTNVGAVVGGLYCAGVSIDALEEMFTKKSLIRAYLTVPVKLRMCATPIFYIPRLAGRHSYDGMYRGNRFRKFLNRYVPQSEQDIKDLKIPFGAVVLSLIDGQIHTLRAGNLGRALQASSAIPVLRKPVEIGDDLYVDGGVTCNLPVQQVREMGADIVIAVDLDRVEERVEKKEFFKIGSVSHRIVTIHLNDSDTDAIKSANIVIKPEVADIGLISTSSEDAKNAINAGERAALAAVEELEKLKITRKSASPQSD